MSKFSPMANAPQYMHRFQCLGSECPTNCCHGWLIPLDKATVKKYKTITVQPLRDRLVNAVDKFEDVSGKHYGAMRLNEEGMCTMLDSDRLCSIQKAVGHTELSPTCQTYPRVYQEYYGDLELSGDLSCSQVARLVLSDPDALQMQPLELTRFANIGQVPIRTSVGMNSLGVVSDVHRISSAALHDRLQWIAEQPQWNAAQVLSLWTLLVRDVCQWRQKWQEAEGDGPYSEEIWSLYMGQLADLFDLYSLEGLELRLQLVDEITTDDTAVVLDVLAGITQGLADKPHPSQGLREILNEIKDRPLEPLLKEGRQLVDAFERANPHVFKNFLLNDVLKNKWFALVLDPQGLEQGLLSLVLRFVMVRFWSAVPALDRPQEFGLEDVIRVTHTVSRALDHDGVFMPNIIAALAKSNTQSNAVTLMLQR